MKKVTLLAITLTVAVLMTAPVFAQNSSSKFAAQVSSVALVCGSGANSCPGVKNLGWTEILRTSIKTPNQKDLLIGASLETGLYTQTLVKSSGGVKDSSTAAATLLVKVEVDGVPAQPGIVTYDMRSQTLSATLGGYYTACQDLNGDGIIDVTTECQLTPEEIELILDTMGAHHFNFVLRNLSPGVHQVKAYAMISTDTAFQNGSANATALVGKGSLTVEEVRGTNAPEGIVFLQ